MGKSSKKTRAKAAQPQPTGDDALAADMKDLKLDPRGDGMYSGTFRWLETKAFTTLPPFPHAKDTENNSDAEMLCLTKGWEGYLRSRDSESGDLVESTVKDPSCLDALSFPLTFLHVASTLQLLEGSTSEKHIVVLGATRKAEQRVWLITDYWFELAHYFASKQITLWFVGPEAEETCSPQKRRQPKNLRVKHLEGTFRDFIKHADASECSPSNTVLIGYNTGFGNFVDSSRYDLLFSWLPDLYAISDAGFPAIFTCANDYADMNGEFAVQSRIIGANMLLLPQQNPFSMASHLHEDGKKETAWSRGNSFLYAIQGCDLSRRMRLKDGDVIALQNQLDASLDLHLQDALGRHFYKGMVLSKEQVSRCKALTNPGSQQATRQRSSSASRMTSPSTLKTPTFQIHSGSQDKEAVILVHIPGVDGSNRIAVDVSDTTLTLFIPDKYALRASLPFQVENNAPVRAELAPPYLKITCTHL